MKKSIYIFFLVFFANNLLAQSFFNDGYKHFSVDTYLGVPVFYGDIPNQMSIGFSSKLNWHLTNALSINAEFTLGSLNGFDEKTNDAFSNVFVKTMFGAEAYLFNIFHLNKISNIVQPFAGISIGGIKSSIVKSETKGIENVDKNKSWAFLYNISGGVKVRVSKVVDINFRAIINLPKTDLLDNYNPSVVNNKHDDTFNEFSLGATFHLGKNAKTPIIWKSVESNLGSRNRNKVIDISELIDNFDATQEKIADFEKEEKATEKQISKDIDKNEFDCIIKL